MTVDFSLLEITLQLYHAAARIHHRRKEVLAGDYGDARMHDLECAAAGSSL